MDFAGIYHGLAIYKLYFVTGTFCPNTGVGKIMEIGAIALLSDKVNAYMKVSN